MATFINHVNVGLINALCISSNLLVYKPFPLSTMTSSALNNILENHNNVFFSISCFNPRHFNYSFISINLIICVKRLSVIIHINPLMSNKLCVKCDKSLGQGPGKHETYTQCGLNAGPASKTLVQHWKSIGTVLRVFWGWMTPPYSSLC